MHSKLRISVFTLIITILFLLPIWGQAENIIADPSKTKVLVNGKTVAFEAYTINGNCYVKLRDVAYAINGTKSQFDVTYDSTSKATRLLSNKPYKAVGGELAKGNQKRKTAVLNTSPVSKDEFTVNLKSYTINGAIYFSIMDIARMFNFSAVRDTGKNTIVIDSNKEFEMLLPRYCEAMIFGRMLWSEKDQSWRGVDDYGNMPAGWIQVADDDIRLYYSFSGGTPQLVAYMNIISDGRFYFLEDKLVYKKVINGKNIPLDADGGISPEDLQSVLGDEYKDFVDKHTFTLMPSVGYPAPRKLKADTVKYKISIGNGNVSIGACEKYQISPKLSPKPASTKKLAYSSSDKSIAFVDENGIVYGIKAGKCTISVYLSDRKDIKPAQLTVTVTGGDVTNKISTGCILFDYLDDEVSSRFTESTVNAAKNDKAAWLGYFNTFSYISMEPVKIGDITPAPNRYSFRNLNEDEFERIVKLTHENGMKFVAQNQILYDRMMEQYITEEAMHSMELFWQQTQDFYTKFGLFLCDKSFELEKTPSKAVNDFWDDWFRGYEEIMIPYAQLCEKYGADMFVLGEAQLNHTYRANEARWRALVAKIRKVYSGKIGAICNYFDNNPAINELETNKFIDCLDYVVVRLNEPFSTVPNPSIEEYKAELEDFFDKQIDGLYKKYGKKFIITASYKSIENAGVLPAFEVGKMQPDLKRDFAIQASMYEALLESVSDEEWIEAVWSSGYTWMDEFELGNGALCALDKGHSVRNKPAAEIIKKWSK